MCGGRGARAVNALETWKQTFTVPDLHEYVYICACGRFIESRQVLGRIATHRCLIMGVKTVLFVGTYLLAMDASR